MKGLKVGNARGFARLYWRVRIETSLPISQNLTPLRVSPAFIGGCGLKPRPPSFRPRPGSRFARLYWRVRIETQYPPTA